MSSKFVFIKVIKSFNIDDRFGNYDVIIVKFNSLFWI